MTAAAGRDLRLDRQLVDPRVQRHVVGIVDVQAAGAMTQVSQPCGPSLPNAAEPWGVAASCASTVSWQVVQVSAPTKVASPGAALVSPVAGGAGSCAALACAAIVCGGPCAVPDAS